MKHLHDISLPEEALTYTKRELRSPKTTRVTCRLLPDEFEKLKTVAKELDKSKSQVIREALEMYYNYWFE